MIYICDRSAVNVQVRWVSVPLVTPEGVCIRHRAHQSRFWAQSHTFRPPARAMSYTGPGDSFNPTPERDVIPPRLHKRPSGLGRVTLKYNNPGESRRIFASDIPDWESDDK